MLSIFTSSSGETVPFSYCFLHTHLYYQWHRAKQPMVTTARMGSEMLGQPRRDCLTRKELKVKLPTYTHIHKHNNTRGMATRLHMHMHQTDQILI